MSQERMDAVAEKLRFGLSCQETGRLAEAEAAFVEALNWMPDEPEILSLLGGVKHRRQEYDQAMACFVRAIGLRADRFHYHAQLGQTLRAMGRLVAAEERFRAALALSADNPELRVNLGGVLQEQGRLTEAVQQYRLALEQDPALVEAHYNLGSACKALGEEGEAQAAYRAAIQGRPDHHRAHYNLGVLLQDAGRSEEGVACFRRAWHLRPDYARARWKMELDLPVLLTESVQVEPLRARWRAGVERLLQCDLSTPEAIAEAWEAASAVSNFYLNYQGQNDLDEQVLYGRLLTRVARAAFPAYAQPMGSVRRGRRLRVGFVSSFFYGHSIFKTHSRWITRLDGERFVFYTGWREDLSTRYIRERVEHFQMFPPSVPASVLIEAMVAARLDVLIYTDLGMDARLHPLSALRLAPIQCNGGGHPVTSGVEAVDCFLSSDLMEPEHGQAHYSERLIRLPHLASCYPVPNTAMACVPAGFEPGRVTYVNLQSLFKLLPEHDVVYPRIASQVPGSRFYFIEVNATVSALFMNRLRVAFACFGLDAEAHCRLVPRMGQDAFFGLARSADVILDGIGWSGNNSSLEALAFDRPIVTVAGAFFRNRHTCGILRRLGMEETVARDVDEFVEIAVHLGQDAGLRQQLQARIARDKGILYEDAEVPQALGRILTELVDALP